MGFIKSKTYNYHLQVVNMKYKFPQFNYNKTKEGYDFVGNLRPKIIEYKVKIMYRKKYSPKVFVLEPKITDNKHRYSDGSLCLYKNAEFKWREDLLISDYIVPFTASWLYFHEVYELTGNWYGPESAHATGEIKQFIDI